MLYQIQYRVHGRKPTRKLIDQAREAYAKNLPLPQGVTVKPLAWLGNLELLRSALNQQTAFVGDAGIVKQYAGAELSFCDYDQKFRAPLHFVLRLGEMVQAKPLWIREDKTAHGWHMIICWSRSFKPIEQVALQAILGSDPQRELYNLARVLSGKRSRRWNLLFERKL